MIGIFIIATGPYIKFVNELVNGLNKHFLSGHQKTIYVLTDSKCLPGEVVCYNIVHNPWPAPTLMRYHYILNAVHDLKIKHRYYYYIDADMKCVDVVGDEILGQLVATRHPGFYHKTPDQFSLETKFLSRAYVKYSKFYYCGGFNGGMNYLKMAEQIKTWVNIDQKHGHTPKYHDEMYLNKYLVDNTPDVILSPSYCMPETTRERITYGLMNLSPKIICLTKTTNYHT
jgi:histo-blood group ABO system transferase